METLDRRMALSLPDAGFGGPFVIQVPLSPFVVMSESLRNTY